MEEFHRNLTVSLACGFLFGVSWWIMIDIVCMYPSVSSFGHGVLFLPILLSSLSLLLNGFIPNSSLSENFVLNRVIVFHRICFFVAVSIGFGGVLAAIILCVANKAASLPNYALIGIPILNIFILVSNLLFKFTVVDESNDIFN